MFERFFAPNPLKDSSDKLEAYCPQTELWPQVRAYLNQGKKPKDPKAVNAVRAYLDLREHLGSRAAFKNGAPLSHEALADDCCRFFRAYEGQEHIDNDSCRKWAQFCLAADYVLACAYSAKLLEGKLRRKHAARVAQLYERIRVEYLEPMKQSAAAPAVKAEPVQAKAA